MFGLTGIHRDARKIITDPKLEAITNFRNAFEKQQNLLSRRNELMLIENKNKKETHALVRIERRISQNEKNLSWGADYLINRAFTEQELATIFKATKWDAPIVSVKSISKPFIPSAIISSRLYLSGAVSGKIAVAVGFVLIAVTLTINDKLTDLNKGVIITSNWLKKAQGILAKNQP